MQLTDVQKRSQIAIERKIAKDVAFGYKQGFLKLYRTVKMAPNQDDLNIKYFEIETNNIEGFNDNMFPGNVRDNLKGIEISEDTKKYLILSSYIVGESESGLSWLIKSPFNDLTFAISKKYIPALRDSTIEELANLKKDKVVEIYWHINETTTIRNWSNKEITSYLGRKKIKFLMNTARDLHLLAIKALVWEANKVSFVKFLDSTGKVVQKEQQQDNGEELVTEENIINQLMKNSKIKNKAIFYNEHEEELKSKDSSPPKENLSPEEIIALANEM